MNVDVLYDFDGVIAGPDVPGSYEKASAAKMGTSTGNQSNLLWPVAYKCIYTCVSSCRFTLIFMFFMVKTSDLAGSTVCLHSQATRPVAM